MKKKFKRLIALAAAALMVLVTAATAYGAKVTINDSKGVLAGHTFKAYQIFKGTQAEGDAHLGDIEWGDGIDGTSFLAALKDDKLIGSAFANIDAALKTAEAIAGLTDSESQIRVAQIAYENKTTTGTALATTDTNDLPAGYYLIVDETKFATDAENALRNAALLQVTNEGEVEVKVKVDKPTVDKTVTGETQIVDDYNIGDTVPFTVTSKIPDTDQYQTYTYKFHDTMSDGLTYNKDSLNITIGEVKVVENGSVVESYKDCVTITPAEGDTLTVEIKVKTKDEATGIVTTNFEAAKEITITYTGTLNENAVIGKGTNPDDPANYNKVYLEYSSNPNDEEDTTTTPEDKVNVYAFGLEITKVDGEGDDAKPLTGAEFVLYREKAADSGEEEEDEAESVKEYVEVEGTALNYKVKDWTKEKTEAGNLVVDDEGKLNIDGLKAGTYYLEETKAPEGYNKLKEPIEIVIDPTYDETTGVLTTLSIKAGKTDATVDVENGTGSFNVVNNQGFELPETGGMGTTILYVAGILAVAGALFFFVMNRRKNRE